MGYQSCFKNYVISTSVYRQSTFLVGRRFSDIKRLGEDGEDQTTTGKYEKVVGNFSVVTRGLRNWQCAQTKVGLN